MLLKDGQPHTASIVLVYVSFFFFFLGTLIRGRNVLFMKACSFGVLQVHVKQHIVETLFKVHFIFFFLFSVFFLVLPL